MKSVMAIICILFFFSCMGPAVRDYNNQGPSIGVQNNKPGICDYDPNKPDCDGDRMNDDCELAIGTEVCSPDSDNDGIQDALDCPPNDPECENVKEKSFFAQAADKLKNEVLVGNSALSSKASPGTSVTITKQELFLADANHLSLIPKGIVDLCQGKTPFLAISVRASIVIEKCLSNTSSQCTNEIVPNVALDLCAGNINADFNGNTLNITDFKWTHAEAGNLRKFNPNVLVDKSVVQNTELNFEVLDKKMLDEGELITKIEIDWDNKWVVHGDFEGTDQNTSFDSQTFKVKNKWKRINQSEIDLGFNGHYAATNG